MKARMILFFAMMGFALNANARPFSTVEEVQYLKTAIQQIATAEGYTLIENSLTLEPWGDTVNALYNISPFRLFTGPEDDRAYWVYFQLQNATTTIPGQIHFRSVADHCVFRNNTSVEQVSSLSGRNGCMSLHISVWANELNKTVSLKSMLP